MLDQAWEVIHKMGNRLHHADDRVDPAIVWNVITGRFPHLKLDFAEVLEPLRAAGEA